MQTLFYAEHANMFFSKENTVFAYVLFLWFLSNAKMLKITLTARSGCFLLWSSLRFFLSYFSVFCCTDLSTQDTVRSQRYLCVLMVTVWIEYRLLCFASLITCRGFIFWPWFEAWTQYWNIWRYSGKRQWEWCSHGVLSIVPFGLSEKRSDRFGYRIICVDAQGEDFKQACFFVRVFRWPLNGL